jgi:hypothetical protein
MATPRTPQAPGPRRGWFWWSVAAGIIANVVFNAGLGSGPAQVAAFEAIATGVAFGLIAAVVRWVRGGGIGDALFIGALTSLFARGVEEIRRPPH